MKALSTSPKVRELYKKKRRRNRIKIIIFSFLVILAVTGLVFLSRTPIFQITTITISGTRVLDEQELHSIVDAELSEYYLHVIPKRNGLIIPKKAIMQMLYDTFPRIKHISISSPATNELALAITERESISLWCGVSVPKDLNDLSCFYLDENGYVFSKAPYFSGNIYLRFFGPLSDIGDDPIGKNFLDAVSFHNILQFQDGTTALGLPPSAFIVGDTEYDFLLADKIDENKDKIIISDLSILPRTLDNLASALAVEPLKSDVVKKFDSLLYIDLRYGDKVYYKFSK